MHAVALRQARSPGASCSEPHSRRLTSAALSSPPYLPQETLYAKYITSPTMPPHGSAVALKVKGPVLGVLAGFVFAGSIRFWLNNRGPDLGGAHRGLPPTCTPEYYHISKTLESYRDYMVRRCAPRVGRGGMPGSVAGPPAQRASAVVGPSSPDSSPLPASRTVLSTSKAQMCTSKMLRLCLYL